MTAVCTTPLPHMTGVTSPAGGRLLGETGQMTFRVRGGEHDGRVLRIRAAKCTIGSARGCTLRLRAAGIRPLACWVLRGTAGTVVRRMEGPATLNGARFEEAALRGGDCLRIGSVELQVVECNEPAPLPAPFFPPPASTAADTAEVQMELTRLQDRTLRLEAECRQGFESSIMAAERADQLRDALAVAHEQLENLSNELAAVQDSAAQQAEELEAKHRELDQVHAQQRSLATQRDELVRQHGELVRQRDELLHERQTLANDRESFDRSRESWAQEREMLVSERQSLVQERDALLGERNAVQGERDRLQAELQASHAALEVEQERFAAERTQLERRLAQRDAEIEALRGSSAAQTGAMTVAMSELTQTHAGVREELSARCAELEAQLALERNNFESQLAALRSERDGQLQTQKTEWEAQVAAQQQEFAARVASKQATIDELQAQIAARQADLEGQLHGQQATIEQLQAQLAASQSQFDAVLASKQGDLDASAQRTGELEANIACLQGKLGELEGQRQSTEADLRRELAEKCREIEECRQRLEAQAATAATADDVNARQQELSREQTEIQARLANLEQRDQELASARAALEADQAKLAQIREQCDLDRDELLLAKQEVADAQEQLTLERLSIEQQREWLLADKAQQQAIGNEQQATNAAAAELEAKTSLLNEQLAAAAARLAEIERLRDELLCEKQALATAQEQLTQERLSMEQQRHGLGASISESDAVKAQQTPTPPHEAAQGPAYQLDSGVEREVQAESASTAEPELATPDDAPCIDSSSNSGEMSVNCTAVWSAEQFASLDEAPSCETPASEPEINSAAPEQENEGGGRDSGDVDALLGRLVRAGLWRSDEASASAPAKEVEQPSSPPREITIRQAAKQPYAEQALPAQDVSEEPLEQPTYAQTASISDEEESIESYMERLMKRVRGDAPPGPVVRDPIVETPPPPAVAVEPVPEAKQPAEEESENYCPRRTAPELVTNLSAMRELANTAARSAIDRHVRQHTGKQAAGKLVGAGLTIAASGLVGYWALRANSLPACVAAVIGGCAGCYWTLAAFKRLSTLRRLNQLSARETPKSQPGSSSPPAAG